MSGGIPWLTLPAGYLGSGLIGAALIACGFDTNASKVASLVLAVFFIFTLWWARRNVLYVYFIFFPAALHLGRSPRISRIDGDGGVLWRSSLFFFP